MKKLLTTMMATALLPLSATAQAEGPIDGKIYGRLNTALVVQDDGTTEDTSVINNASRLGLAGKTDLGDGLKAVYKLEYEIAPDEKAADTAGTSGGIFKQRDAWLGLETPYGTVLGGTHDTPLKLAQGRIDMFNDLPVGDIKSVVNGEVRAQDAIVYASPKFNGVSLLAASQAQENTDGDNGVSASVSYDQDGIYVSLAMEQDVATYDGMRLAAQYSQKDFTVGALFNQSEKSDGSADKKDGWIVSGSYKLDKTTLKLQLGQGDEISMGRDFMAAGADYKLGDKTKLYAFYAGYEDDASNEKTAYGLGMEHNF